jgi:hypothetical protein
MSDAVGFGVRAKVERAGFELAAQPVGISVPRSPIIEHMHQPWDPEKYLIARAPIDIGVVSDLDAFADGLPAPVFENWYCHAGTPALDMPIKFPGSLFRVPAEFQRYAGAVQQIIDYETAVNEFVDRYFCYLTIDQAWVNAGEFHRRPGAHFDGIQGPRYPTKLWPDHSYIVSSDAGTGTTFYVQGFDFRNADVAAVNWRPLVPMQADEQNTLVAEAGHIYLIDAYVAHRCTQSARDVRRTFLRMEFSLKVYDRLGNSVNPLFQDETSYLWPYVDRPLPAGLR